MAETTVAVAVPAHIYDELCHLAAKYDTTIGKAMGMWKAEYENQIEELKEGKVEKEANLVDRMDKIEKQVSALLNEKEIEPEEEKEVFYCATCDREFDTKKGLEIHRGRVHKD